MTRDPWLKVSPASGDPSLSQSDEMTGRLYSGLTPVRHGKHAARTVVEVDDDLADQAPEPLGDCESLIERNRDTIDEYLADLRRTVGGAESAIRRARSVPAWVSAVFAWIVAAAAIVVAARVTVPSQGVTLGMGIAVGAAVGMLGVDRAARRYARRLHTTLTRGERP